MAVQGVEGEWWKLGLNICGVLRWAKIGMKSLGTDAPAGGGLFAGRPFTASPTRHARAEALPRPAAFGGRRAVGGAGTGIEKKSGQASEGDRCCLSSQEPCERTPEGWIDLSRARWRRVATLGEEAAVTQNLKPCAFRQSGCRAADRAVSLPALLQFPHLERGAQQPDVFCAPRVAPVAATGMRFLRSLHG